MQIPWEGPWQPQSRAGCVHSTMLAPRTAPPKHSQGLISYSPQRGTEVSSNGVSHKPPDLGVRNQLIAGLKMSNGLQHVPV